MRKKERLLQLVNPLLAPLGVRLDFAQRFRTSKPAPLDGTVDLASLAAALSPRIEMAVLGSLDESFGVPDNLRAHVRLFSLDAVAPGGGGTDGSIVPLRDVVAGRSGPTRFLERVVTGVSSTLEPKPELVALYGLEWMYQLKKAHEVDAITLGDIAQRHGVFHWDYVRTDLEGADHSVVAAMGDAVRDVSMIEMELRVEPFYRGEPTMTEVLAYMDAQGFEVLDLKPERWRATTPHRMYETRGRATFCNTVFVNRAKVSAAPDRLLRHALVVGLLGYANFAERLLQPLTSSHAPAVAALQQLFFRRATLSYLPMPGMPHVTHGAAY